MQHDLEYDVNKTYTADEYFYFWENIKRAGINEFQFINNYTNYLIKLRDHDLPALIAEVPRILTVFLTDSANNETPDTAGWFQSDLLSHILCDERVCSALKHDSENYYAMVSYIFYRAFDGNRQETGRVREPSYYLKLQSLVNALNDGSDKGCQLNIRMVQRITSQLAHMFMSPAWGLLIEPAIESKLDMLRAVWIDRPPLLALPYPSVNSSELGALVSTMEYHV